VKHNRRKETGRRESGSYLALPHAVLDSPALLNLRPAAVKLLLDIGAQFRGTNNGDLCAAWSLMKYRGWKSRQTLADALRELREFGLIQTTRQGGKHRASLYALTWHAIDYCDGKLDTGPTRAPSGLWRQPPQTMPTVRLRPKKKSVTRPAGHIDTAGGAIAQQHAPNWHAARVSQPDSTVLISTPGVSLLRSTTGGKGKAEHKVRELLSTPGEHCAFLAAEHCTPLMSQ